MKSVKWLGGGKIVLENGRVQSILATLEGSFGICILDERGLVQYVNSYFSEITHYQSSQLLQASYKAMNFKVSPSSSDYFETALAGEVWKGEAGLYTTEQVEK